MARPVHEIGGILAIVNRELGVEPEAKRVFAQKARSDAMESARIGRRRLRGGLRRELAAEQPLYAAAKLGRGAARKGREHDALGISAGQDERRHPMRKHRRFPRASARDDEQRPRSFRIAEAIVDRELLLGIEIDGWARANQGERHGSTQPCFSLCSQGANVGHRISECADQPEVPSARALATAQKPVFQTSREGRSWRRNCDHSLRDADRSGGDILAAALGP